MSRFLTRFLLLLFISVITIVIYLSYFGIKTDKFDDLIKGKANEVSRYAKLEFNKTKIHLNLKELNLAVRLQNPRILIRSNEIILSSKINKEIKGIKKIVKSEDIEDVFGFLASIHIIE